MKRRCGYCGKVIKRHVMHCMVNGNDVDFCSETCIREYYLSTKEAVTFIEKYEVEQPWCIS